MQRGKVSDRPLEKRMDAPMMGIRVRIEMSQTQDRFGAMSGSGGDGFHKQTLQRHSVIRPQLKQVSFCQCGSSSDVE